MSTVVDGGNIVRSGLLTQAIKSLTRGPRRLESRHDEFVMTERFTARELDVLRHVAQGEPNKKIAGELNLAEVTVKKHVQNIIGKLGASDRTHAAVLAVGMGLAV